MRTAHPHPFAVHSLHFHGFNIHFPAVSQKRSKRILRLPVLLDVLMLHNTVNPFDQLHQILILLLRTACLYVNLCFPKNCHFSLIPPLLKQALSCGLQLSPLFFLFCIFPFCIFSNPITEAFMRKAEKFPIYL